MNHPLKVGAALNFIDLVIPFEGYVTRKTRAAIAKAKGEPQ